MPVSKSAEESTSLSVIKRTLSLHAEKIKHCKRFEWQHTDICLSKALPDVYVCSTSLRSSSLTLSQIFETQTHNSLQTAAQLLVLVQIRWTGNGALSNNFTFCRCCQPISASRNTSPSIVNFLSTLQSRHKGESITYSNNPCITGFPKWSISHSCLHHIIKCCTTIGNSWKSAISSPQVCLGNVTDQLSVKEP